MLHQTAAEFGVSRRLLRRFKGNRERARRWRLGSTPYHYVVTTDGHVLRNYPLDAWTYHAAGAPNATAIGVAIEAKLSRFGMDDYPFETVQRWAAALLFVRLDIERILRSPPPPLVTHAQCSETKRVDPGFLAMVAANESWPEHLHARDWSQAGGVPQPNEWRNASFASLVQPNPNPNPNTQPKE